MDIDSAFLAAWRSSSKDSTYEISPSILIWQLVLLWWLFWHFLRAASLFYTEDTILVQILYPSPLRCSLSPEVVLHILVILRATVNCICLQWSISAVKMLWWSASWWLCPPMLSLTLFVLLLNLFLTCPLTTSYPSVGATEFKFGCLHKQGKFNQWLHY